ncbi:hypothetical protein BT69DRAFT_1331299 [Atractiella rhizophila]|nr:hypothetical protein BT69DRAFT_1331299 [Atractiella rhizophila]
MSKKAARITVRTRAHTWRTSEPSDRQAPDDQSTEGDEQQNPPEPVSIVPSIRTRSQAREASISSRASRTSQVSSHPAIKRARTNPVSNTYPPEHPSSSRTHRSQIQPQYRRASHARRPNIIRSEPVRGRLDNIPSESISGLEKTAFTFNHEVIDTDAWLE